MLRPTLTATIALSALSLSSPALTAQVPAGHLLVSGFAWTNTFSGLGGLFFVDATTTPATVTAVSGLPCELTGACTSPNSPWTGPDLVVRLPATQQIVTNGPVWAQHMLNAYVVTLNGSAVANVDVYPLAVYSNNNGLGIPAAALLDDDRVLFVLDPGSTVAPGPLAGAFLGILDPTLPPNDPNAVTPVAVNPVPPGMPNAMVVDRDRQMAYVAMENGIVYAIPVAGGAPQQIAAVPGSVNAMCLQANGEILAGGFVSPPVQARLWRVDPATGQSTVLAAGLGSGAVNAVWQDPVSGNVHFAQFQFGTAVSRLRQRDPQGAVTDVTSGPTGGWGCTSGLDGYARIETYGGASGSAPIARWDLAPNPGGAPTLGNGTFSLTNQPPASAVLSLWAIGFDRATPAITLPTSPATLLLVQPVTSEFRVQQSSLPLPLPGNPAFAGVELYFQCWHWDAAAMLSASSGVRVTL